MGDMAYVVTAGAQRGEEFDGNRSSNVNLHGNRYWKRNQPNLPVGEHDRGSQQYTVNRSRCSDRRVRYGYAWPERIDHRFDQNSRQPCSNSRQEKIHIETMRAPCALQIRAEHPQEKHVEQDVQDSIV